MKLARLISMNAFTRLASRNAEAVNINVAVAANFTKPNGIIAAFKQQTVIRPFWTPAQEDSFKGRPSDARHSGCFSLTKRRLRTIVERLSRASGRLLQGLDHLTQATQRVRDSRDERGHARVRNQLTFSARHGGMLLT